MNAIPEDALVTPAVELFANDMRLESIRSEMGDWIAGANGPLCDFLRSDWTQLGLAVLAFALGVHVCRKIVGSMCPNSRVWRFVLTAWFCACSYIGVTKVKSILLSSGSDDGTTLVSAVCGVTNGYSFVEVKATGGDPGPMWYREANDWILAENEGWNAISLDHSGAMYSREWRHSDTNDLVITHQMWYFGQNPPAVELTATGGITILSAMFTGKFVRFTWCIDQDVSLPPGSEVHLQNIFLDDRLPMWEDRVVDQYPDHQTNETAVTGFFLDRRTAWRFRLEVPR